MVGEKEQLNSEVKFTGYPNDSDKPKEKNIFKRFIAYIAPWAVKARNITEDYYTGEASKRIKEAEKFAAETAEIAAKTELARLEKVKIENELIDQIFRDDNLPTNAKMLKLANILSNNPQLKQQMQKVDEMMTILKAVNFSQIEIGIKSNTTISSKSQKIDDIKSIHNLDNETENEIEDEESFKLMRKLLKTKLVDMDFSVKLLNIFRQAEIETVSDLVSRNLNDLFKIKYFKDKDLESLETILNLKGLSLGMDLSKYKLDEED